MFNWIAYKLILRVFVVLTSCWVDYEGRSLIKVFLTLQIEVRDREIERLAGLLATDGRPVRALAEDCCFKNYKQLQEDVNHLQKENTLLRNRVARLNQVPSSETKPMDYYGENIGSDCGQAKGMGTCDGIVRQMKEKDIEIKRLQQDYTKCLDGAMRRDRQEQMNTALICRCKLGEQLLQEQKRSNELLKNLANSYQTSKANTEVPSHCASENGMDGRTMDELANIQRQMDCIRKELAQLSCFNRSHDTVRNLKSDLALKESEIANLKNRSCLSAASFCNIRNMSGSDAASMQIQNCGESAIPRSTLDCDKIRLQRENERQRSKIEDLECERDQLQRQLNIELNKICRERSSYNHTLDGLKRRIEELEEDKAKIIFQEEPKNAAIKQMREDICLLREEVNRLHCERDGLTFENEKLKQISEQQRRALCNEHDLRLQSENKLEQTKKELEKCNSADKVLNCEVSRLRGELKRCRSNYQCLESENMKLSAELIEKLELMRTFQDELDKTKKTSAQMRVEFQEMENKYK